MKITVRCPGCGREKHLPEKDSYEAMDLWDFCSECGDRTIVVRIEAGK